MASSRSRKWPSAPANSGAFTPCSITLRRSARFFSSGMAAMFASRTSSGCWSSARRGPMANVTTGAAGCTCSSSRFTHMRIAWRAAGSSGRFAGCGNASSRYSLISDDSTSTRSGVHERRYDVARVELHVLRVVLAAADQVDDARLEFEALLGEYQSHLLRAGRDVVVVEGEHRLLGAPGAGVARRHLLLRGREAFQREAPGTRERLVRCRETRPGPRDQKGMSSSAGGGMSSGGPPPKPPPSNPPSSKPPAPPTRSMVQTSRLLK